MQGMRAHMDSMQGLSGDRAMTMLAVHRQRVEEMLARMDDEMGGMEMEADEGREALADSVRTDLGRMGRRCDAYRPGILAGHADDREGQKDADRA